MINISRYLLMNVLVIVLIMTNCFPIFNSMNYWWEISLILIIIVFYLFLTLGVRKQRVYICRFTISRLELYKLQEYTKSTCRFLLEDTELGIQVTLITTRFKDIPEGESYSVYSLDYDARLRFKE